MRPGLILVAAFALQRLGHLLGEPRYLTAAERTLRLFWPTLSQSPAGFGSLLPALAEALTPPDIVVLRGPAQDLLGWQRFLGADPCRLVLALPNGLNDLPAALGKPESARAQAWLCRGAACLAPVAGMPALKPLLAFPEKCNAV